MPQTSTLVLRAAQKDLEALTPLAREGLGVEISAGRTVRQTLTGDLGFCPECVEERIQTVFLDGSPVDDIDQDAAAPGCTMALAAAMPGIAGMAMRRGSPVGVFREGVTHHADPKALAADTQAPRFRITLKLFNLVAVECLAWVLSCGAFVPAARLGEVLAADPHALVDAVYTLDDLRLSRAEAIAALSAMPGEIRVVALL